MEYLINIFTKPKYEMNFIDNFVLTIVFIGVIFLIYLVYTIIEDVKKQKRK